MAGMSCASCTARVEKAARAVPGVAEASVNLATETLHLRAGPGFEPRALERAVEQAGYAIASHTLTLAVHDMSCASCVGRVEQALKRVPGVLEADVNLATETALVRVTGAEGTGAETAAALLAAARAAGHGAGRGTGGRPAPAPRGLGGGWGGRGSALATGACRIRLSVMAR